MEKCTLTQARVKEVLKYDPYTGHFKWKVQLSNRVKVGMVAGFKMANDRRYLRVDGHTVLIHRLAWFYINGEWPDQIDHINHNPLDNRLCNLRSVTNSENMKNQSLSKASKSGIPGVLFHKRDEIWYAQIRSSKVCYHLGTFTNFFEACCARKSAEVKYNFHPNHGTKVKTNCQTTKEVH